jgi:Reverse transcriptase (RNA-dependent DNA polymerase)
VVQGHRDKEKNFLVHNSITNKQSSIRLILSIAAILEFRVWSQDVRQAYLQSFENIRRKVYLKPSKEFGLPPDHLLELVKQLYGLPDAGDYWENTMTKNLREDLQMKNISGDMSLFYKSISKRLQGLNGTYVDDSLLAGNDNFMKLSDKTMQLFESRDREMDNNKFAGVNIVTKSAGFETQQRDYIEKLSILPTEAPFSDFRSKRAQLAWITHTRPDICCAVNMAAQVTEGKYTEKNINDLNKTIIHLKKDPSHSLKFHKLKLKSLRLKVYSDSSFANIEDLTSQLGYIILLTDMTGICNVIHYSSHKSRRVTRSVLGGEVYAFADAFDQAFIIKHDLELLLNQRVPLTILTDSKSLFDVITKSSSTSERRLMIDITAVREAYFKQEISDVGFVRTKNNPADAFTKVGKCDALEYI